MKPKLAAQIMLFQLIAVTVFHLCIITGIIPYDITWGGRLKTDQEMYVFEAFSLFLNMVLILAVLIKGKLIKPIISERIANIILWIFFGLFALNTIGNLLAETNLEKYFALLTLSSCFLIWMILKKTASS
jgi:hypothetical protein